MSVARLLLVLPTHHSGSTGADLTVHGWGAILEQFAAHGGHEVFMGGTEPLACPAFWALVRRSLKLRIPQVTAYLSGSLLEPWVVRELVQSRVHLLVSLDSLTPANHDSLHGFGAYDRAVAALESFLQQGLAERLSILAVANRLNHLELPELAAWAAERGLARMLWSTVPDGGWPSPELKALRLSPGEKTALAASMQAAAAAQAGRLRVGPLDCPDDPEFCGATYSGLLRVTRTGEAAFGFSGEDGFLGNLRRATLQDLLDRRSQAAGD